MQSMRYAPLLLAALAVLACGGGDGPTEPGGLRLSAASPVMSSAGPANDCAVFDVTIRDLSLRGGRIDYLDTEAVRAADGASLNLLRRTGDGGAIPDAELPPAGVLVTETGVCWPIQPAGTEVRIRITVEIDPGDRRATLTLPVLDWREA